MYSNYTKCTHKTQLFFRVHSFLPVSVMTCAGRLDSLPAWFSEGLDVHVCGMAARSDDEDDISEKIRQLEKEKKKLEKQSLEKKYRELSKTVTSLREGRTLAYEPSDHDTANMRLTSPSPSRDKNRQSERSVLRFIVLVKIIVAIMLVLHLEMGNRKITWGKTEQINDLNNAFVLGFL